MVQSKSLKDLHGHSHLDKPFTASPNKYPQGKFNEKECKSLCCSVKFKPLAPSHLYCSVECKKEARSDGYYQKTYGITGKEALDLYNAQDGLCKICGGEGFLMHKNKKHGLNLDHCHTTGKVRGWLCDNCNRGIGLLQDDVNILEKAIGYINDTRDEETTKGGTGEVV